MAAPEPLHADRANDRTHDPRDRRRAHPDRHHGRMIHGYLKRHPNFHHVDGRDPRGASASVASPRVARAASGANRLSPIAIQPVQALLRDRQHLTSCVLAPGCVDPPGLPGGFLGGFNDCGGAGVRYAAGLPGVMDRPTQADTSMEPGAGNPPPVLSVDELWSGFCIGG